MSSEGRRVVTISATQVAPAFLQTLMAVGGDQQMQMITHPPPNNQAGGSQVHRSLLAKHLVDKPVSPKVICFDWRQQTNLLMWKPPTFEIGEGQK